MTTIAELTKNQICLPPYQIAHLQHLVAEWEVLADLAFADLLLFVPSGEGQRFIVLAHIRPSNAETTYFEDPVGDSFSSAERPLVHQTWRSELPSSGEIMFKDAEEPILVSAVPVRCRQEQVAVLSLERWKRSVRRSSSFVEAVYSDLVLRFVAMISEGVFPYQAMGPVPGELMRIGDGFILCDADLKIEVISPNATSVLRRLGFYENYEGSSIRELPFQDAGVWSALRAGEPASDEFQQGDVAILLRVFPLLESSCSAGALILMRDISELRQRDRLLLSKEAAIREMHHRVKNNLQTIASLLQLQARRTSSAEAKVALCQSVRRIRSIALVHETLSGEGAGWLPFDSILVPLLRYVEEGLVNDGRINFSVTGDAGILPAEMSTPLAVVLTELLQNAVEHAFGGVGVEEWNGEKENGTSVDAIQNLIGNVTVEIERDKDRLRVAVTDDGAGFPPDFDFDADAGLGLKIARTLVESELRGEMGIDLGAPGGSVCITVSLPPEESEAELGFHRRERF